jgi:hypothetical protein
VQSEYPTRDEVVEAIAPMAKQIASLEGTVNDLLVAIKGVVEDDETKIAKAASEAPPASVAAMLARNMSAIGDDDTKVKGSEKLAKGKPEEAESTKKVTGIEFIDNIINQEQLVQ